MKQFVECQSVDYIKIFIGVPFSEKCNKGLRHAKRRTAIQLIDNAQNGADRELELKPSFNLKWF